MKRFAILNLILIFSLTLFHCPKPKSKKDKFPSLKSDSLKTEILDIKGYKVKVEIADTEEKRNLGLMFRDYLKPNQGMLFIFDTVGIYPFWMKNTKIPLSIAFIDSAGIIVDIQQMAPYTLNPNLSKKPFLYALEMEQGWFETKEIKIGDTIRNQILKSKN